MSIPTEDQETVIQFSRSEKTCNIYTTDTTVMTRLDKLYKCVAVDKVDGEVVAKKYECPKRFVSFRSIPNFKPDYTPKRTVSQEHIEKMRQAREA